MRRMRATYLLQSVEHSRLRIRRVAVGRREQCAEPLLQRHRSGCLRSRLRCIGRVKLRAQPAVLVAQPRHLVVAVRLKVRSSAAGPTCASTDGNTTWAPLPPCLPAPRLAAMTVRIVLITVSVPSAAFVVITRRLVVLRRNPPSVFIMCPGSLI